MKLVSKVTAAVNGTTLVLAVVAGVIVIGVMLLIGTNVILRYALNRPLGYTASITGFLLLYITFLSAAWVLRKEGHVVVDLVLNRFSQTKQLLLNGITSAMGAILCLLLTWYGALSTWDYFQRGIVVTQGMQQTVPQWPILLVIPIGFFLLFIQFVIRSYKFLKQWRAIQSQE